MFVKSPKFDAQLWKNQRGSESRTNPRLLMVEALESTALELGMLRSDVNALLGPPDRSEPHADIYILGASPYSIDYSYYIIEYDGEGRLASSCTQQG